MYINHQGLQLHALQVWTPSVKLECADGGKLVVDHVAIEHTYVTPLEQGVTRLLPVPKHYGNILGADIQVKANMKRGVSCTRHI